MSCILSRLQFQQEYGIVQRVNGFCEVPLAQVRDARPAQHLKTLVLEHLGGTVNLLLEALADNVKLLDRAVIVAELDVGLEREDDRDAGVGVLASNAEPRVLRRPADPLAQLEDTYIAHREAPIERQLDAVGGGELFSSRCPPRADAPGTPRRTRSPCLPRPPR